MPEVVSNTTPLISLADIGLLWVLNELYGEIRIPEAVMNEIISDPARSEVSSSGWIKVCPVPESPGKRIYSSRLHAGEVGTIILAETLHADLVLMDDNAAKKTAKYLGMKVTGTLGVIMRAKREGLIDAVEPYIRALIEDGMYISPKIIDYVLTESGESQP